MDVVAGCGCPKYEHYAASTDSRIAAAKKAAKDGWRIRLCLEPVLYMPDWQRMYAALIEKIFTQIDKIAVMDVSLGEFRVSSEYLKPMRKQRPDSAVLFIRIR